MSIYTVFGGKGFIGSEFVKRLTNQGHTVYIPERNDTTIYEKKLGVVIYAAGYGDCKNDPHNVLEANTVLLNNILKNAEFDKLVYISSTRVYMNQEDASESSDVKACIDDNRRLFNLTKLVSEELCFQSKQNCLVVRPSNVYGLALNSPLFLPSIIRNAINNGVVDMYVEKDYSKDYISVNNVVDITLALIDEPLVLPQIFNVASGINVTAKDIANVINNNIECEINWHECVNNEVFPQVKMNKLEKYFHFRYDSVLLDLAEMIKEYKLSCGMLKNSIIQKG